MKAYLDCIPCLLNYALKSIRFCTSSEELQKKILKVSLRKLLEADWCLPPPSLAEIVQSTIRELTGNQDPYKEAKLSSNQLLLDHFEELKLKILQSPDNFLTALKIAIAGNIIDYAAVDHEEIDPLQTIDEILQKPLTIDSSAQLKEKLSSAKTLLYLGDNAGEIVCDRLFLSFVLENINSDLQINFVVKEFPTINDATIDDAKTVGIDILPNIVISTVSPWTEKETDGRNEPEFLELLKKYDVVIAKGQGNFEALNDVPGIYFNLLIKCDILSRDLGVPKFSAVCYYSQEK